MRCAAVCLCSIAGLRWTRHIFFIGWPGNLLSRGRFIVTVAVRAVPEWREVDKKESVVFRYTVLLI